MDVWKCSLIRQMAVMILLTVNTSAKDKTGGASLFSLQ